LTLKRLALRAVIACALMAPGAASADMTGRASWYAMGRRTANGEPFRPDGLTAAHRSLRFNTRLLVTDVATGRSVRVRVNDRGPFVRGRILDLSRGAARALGVIARGTVTVRLHPL